MHRITPCLWFEREAEDAARFYILVLKRSKILAVTHYGETGPGPLGSVMTVKFQLDGQEFLGLNGGPQFKFSPAISFIVNCKTQKEIDTYWEKLSEGGQEVQCGWLTDKFGVSWQIVPTALDKLMQGKDAKRSNRMMKALMQMKKLDVKALKEAYNQR